ncbi:TetR/AcrR family transcriptional regulator [Streptacidiphilus anmyonensis]|uniref:TetR/AcrR family transcriptional regulator n=1 Tax=Streptacidiphilus anmyonensis TaxID=405782 RepID=UPI000B00BF87|nr:TetR/AcrR family transcriptional regulator [Streptacidiphilus anmyonensis]
MTDSSTGNADSRPGDAEHPRGSESFGRTMQLLSDVRLREGVDRRGFEEQFGGVPQVVGAMRARSNHERGADGPVSILVGVTPSPATPKPERGTAMRADAARNRARVLQIAREQLAAGDSSLQLNAIARLAGVGVGTVYRHFPTRHALVEALSVERFAQLVDEARAAAEEPDPLAGLHRLLRYALARSLDDPEFAAVLESSRDAEAQTSALKAELDQAVAGLLGRARETGAIRGDVEADDVRRLLCGIEHAVRAGDSDPLRIEVYLSVLLEGLRPPR